MISLHVVMDGMDNAESVEFPTKQEKQMRAIKVNGELPNMASFFKKTKVKRLKHFILGR
jgi:hypothetical protein